MAEILRLVFDDKRARSNRAADLSSLSKIRFFPLNSFCHQVFEEIKKKQDDIKRKKIEFLYQEAYKYFLDLYLMKTAEHHIIDLPSFLYETGRAICLEAKTNAERAVLDVIKADRVNQCYSKRIKEIKKFAAV